MSGRGPVWRAILWIERFLPAAAPAASGEQRPGARRRAMWPLLIYPSIVVMNLFRRRYAVDAMVVQYHTVMEEMSLVIAACSVLAIVAFGAKAWRDAAVHR